MNTKPSSLSSMVPATDAMSTENPHKAARSARWAMLNRFVDEGVRQLTPGAVMVWTILFRSADAKGIVRMSQERIAEKAPINKRQTITHLDTLERLGFLKVIDKGSRNKGPSRYQIFAVSTCRKLQPERGVSGCRKLQPERGVSGCRKLQHETRSSTCRDLQPEPILNMQKPALCYMQNTAPSSERIIKTPAAAKAALAEEEDLRAKSDAIGGSE